MAEIRLGDHESILESSLKPVKTYLENRLVSRPMLPISIAGDLNQL
jgi:hypothetical protein